MSSNYTAEGLASALYEKTIEYNNAVFDIMWNYVINEMLRELNKYKIEPRQDDRTLYHGAIIRCDIGVMNRITNKEYGVVTIRVQDGSITIMTDIGLFLEDSDLYNMEFKAVDGGEIRQHVKRLMRAINAVL